MKSRNLNAAIMARPIATIGMLGAAIFGVGAVGWFLGLALLW